MTLHFDTDQVRDDPAYWDVLAKRVAANAAHRSNASGINWLAHSRMSWIAASLVLATALAFIVLPADKRSANRPDGDWERVFAPADAVGKALVMHNAPPAIGALLLSGASGR